MELGQAMNLTQRRQGAYIALEQFYLANGLKIEPTFRCNQWLCFQTCDQPTRLPSVWTTMAIMVPPTFKVSVQRLEQAITQHGDSLINVAIFFLEDNGLHAFQEEYEFHLKQISPFLELRIFHGDNCGC